MLRRRPPGGREEALSRAPPRSPRTQSRQRPTTRAASLSGGQKKLLEIGRALMAEPKLILLDEPTAGVNPTLANEIADI